MLTYQWFLFTFLALLLAFSSGTNAIILQPRKPTVYPAVYVDPSGQGNFTTIQAAIDSVPSYNTRWTVVYIPQGQYREQIRIPIDKPFIYLRGEGKRKTYVVWDAHDSIATSATFTSEADNIIATAITFVNSYNSPPHSTSNPRMPAPAAKILGDKSAFYKCGFFGLQDTLWDVQGRHYFKSCTIQGAVDFIFGAGQSIYEGCTISVVGETLNGFTGYITAQGRSLPHDTNGFVFKDCKIVGSGMMYLGRPWREYARVLFYNTTMADVIVPPGWDPWSFADRVYLLTFAEHNCRGKGSNTSGRVTWEKKLSEKDLNQLTSISFVDNDGWMRRLPFNILE